MAGGEGRRLKAVTGELPKPMVPLIGKPLMERVIELLRKHGITDIAATLRYNPAPILAHFGDGSRLGVRLHWFIEQEPLGTAGSVKNCASFTGSEDILVLSGDAACDFDLRELMRGHERSGAAVSVALCECPEPLRYGVAVPDENWDLRCFVEKPDWGRVVSDLVSTGIYAISPRAMDYVPEGREFDFARDLFPLLLERGERIHGALLEGYWCDVGTPRAYFQCCLDALDGVLKLPDLKPEPAPGPEPVKRSALPGKRAERRVSCRDRARLMRAVSETMMEAGAALDDGVSLRSEHCALRISPDPERSELRIETAAGDEAFAGELAEALGRMAESLENSTQSGQ